jgi:undecaprenyl phosphate-alpha-L-ara4N flippase subunit ArnF
MKKRPIRGFTSALISILLVSVAQLAMKWGMQSLDLQQLLQSETWISIPFIGLPKDVWPPLSVILLGLCCYGLSMILWIITLQHLPLSQAYPLLSVSYILVYCGTVLLPWFNDSFSSIKLLGIISILFGLLLIFSSKPDPINVTEKT